MLHEDLNFKYLVLLFFSSSSFQFKPNVFLYFSKETVPLTAGMHSYLFLILKPDNVNITSKLAANQTRIYENTYLKGANTEYLY